jgi:hypothetical protein
MMQHHHNEDGQPPDLQALLQRSPNRPPAITIATYNILDGRNSRLPMVCRNLAAQNISVAILMETRIPAQADGLGIHTRSCQGYDIFATYTTTNNQGGIALAFLHDSQEPCIPHRVPSTTRPKHPQLSTCIRPTNHPTHRRLPTTLPP